MSARGKWPKNVRGVHIRKKSGEAVNQADVRGYEDKQQSEKGGWRLGVRVLYKSGELSVEGEGSVNERCKE